MAGEAKTTTNHHTIKKWAEARGGKPVAVKRTERDGDIGLLRIDFPGYSGAESLEEISWDAFFKQFDEKQLAFLYQEQTSSGEESRFFKLVSRESSDDKASKSEEKSQKVESKSGEKTRKDENKSDEKASKTEGKNSEKPRKDENKSDNKAPNAEDKGSEKTRKTESKPDDKARKVDEKARKATRK
jgi:hypothetical protein